jgi:hypothetical protein
MFLLLGVAVTTRQLNGSSVAAHRQRIGSASAAACERHQRPSAAIERQRIGHRAAACINFFFHSQCESRQALSSRATRYRDKNG